jgi:hypothetical protein
MRIKAEQIYEKRQQARQQRGEGIDNAKYSYKCKDMQ